MNHNDMVSVIEGLKKYNRFLISSHVNPEGDSIGAQLALGRFLKGRGKEVVIVDQDPVPDNLLFLSGSDMVFLEIPEDYLPDAVIILDCPVKERIGKIINRVPESLPIINIDHHVSNEFFGDLNWIEAEMSSTGEMLFHLIKETSSSMDKEIAEAIYSAIMTDTGMFNYANTTSRTHRVAADLIDLGVKPDILYKEIFENKDITQIKMLGKVLATIQVEENGMIAYIMLTNEMQREEGITDVTTDEFINYARSIKGVEVALFFKERASDGGMVNVSLRSNGKINVNQVAGQFGGGGHRNAAGCLLHCDINEAKEKVVGMVKKFIKEGI